MASHATARRRVGLMAPNQSRNARLSANIATRNNDFTSDEDDDDEEERLAKNDEEAEELLLSAAHGEASEAPSSTKRKQTDQEIADMYASTTKRRKPRVTFQPTHLTGPDGLIRIRSDFVSLKYPEQRSSVDSAAAYGRSLIESYRGWAYNLFPGLAFDDLLSRVETFGSKRELKNHLNLMRIDIRNSHLESIFGKEGATQMVRELEKGLEQQQLQRAMRHDDEFPMECIGEVTPVIEEEITHHIEPRSITTRLSLSEKKAQPTTKTTPIAPIASVLDDSDSEVELEFDKSMHATRSEPSILFDTDDEDEATKTKVVQSATSLDASVEINTESRSSLGNCSPRTTVNVSVAESPENSNVLLDNETNFADGNTQSTVLASQIETQNDRQGQDATQLSNEGIAFSMNQTHGKIYSTESQVESPARVFETQMESQTQATWIVSEAELCTESQTQATLILASQAGTLDNVPFGTPSQETFVELDTRMMLTDP